MARLVVQRSTAVAARPRPASLLPARASPVDAPTCARPAYAPRTRVLPPANVQRNAISRKVGRAFAFYLMTATMIVLGVGVHEYSHYAAHEGFQLPPIHFSDSVAEAQRDHLRVERSREVLIQQPTQTMIVFYPNTLLQAAALGLVPEDAYQDEGVLASTYFRLDAQEVQALQARGSMPDPVVAAPVWVALAIFALALAWTLIRPNLFSKALLVAYAIQLGDAGHHAGAIGVDAGVFAFFSTVALGVAALVLVLRRPSVRPKPNGQR